MKIIIALDVLITPFLKIITVHVIQILLVWMKLGALNVMMIKKEIQDATKLKDAIIILTMAN